MSERNRPPADPCRPTELRLVRGQEAAKVQPAGGSERPKLATPGEPLPDIRTVAAPILGSLRQLVRFYRERGNVAPGACRFLDTLESALVVLEDAAG